MRFDHLIHWVPDLNAAAAAYRRLGFTIPATPGRHPGMGTENLLWRMTAAYIELLAVHDQAAAARGTGVAWPVIDRLLAQGGGAWRFALLVSDVAETAVRLRARGVEVGGPFEGAIQEADGTVWRLTTATLRGAPSWAPFFINYGLPPDDWEAAWHARGYPRDPWTVTELLIETPQPQAAATWLGDILDLAPATMPAGAHHLAIPGCSLIFTAGEADRVVEVGLRGPQPPRADIHGLSFRPADEPWHGHQAACAH